MENVKNIDISEEEKELKYKTNLPMSEKTNFIVEMSSLVVSNDLGYLPIIKDLIFDYCIIKYFTNAVKLVDKEDFYIDEIEKFVNENSAIIRTIKTELATTCDDLCTACEKAIEYRKENIAIGDKISELNNSIEALINKPDYFSELLISLKGFLDKAKDIEIDMDVVNKLADIIPVLGQMDGKK